ncbi:MAG: hypothetical protein AAB447_01500 [Patescibacteria group bacterium]
MDSPEQFFVFSSLAVAMLTYVFLIKGLFKEIEQSFATWFLWALLDLIAALSMLFKGGNYQLALFYTFFGALITGILLYKKQFSWTWLETVISALVVVCLIIWSVSGDRAATVASSTAMAIATIPQLVAAWKKPETAGSPYIWGGYTVANILSFLGGKSWTIEERFYPMVCIGLCVALTVLTCRKPAMLPVEVK